MTDGAYVIEFPKHRIVRDVPDAALKAALERGKKVQVDNMCLDLVELIYETMDGNGVDVDDDDFNKDMSYLASIIKATYYRQFELPHHLHEFLSDNVELISKKEVEAEFAERQAAKAAAESAADPTEDLMIEVQLES